MCLFVHPDAEVAIAEHDIEVFKVLLKPNEDNPVIDFGRNKLYSPFRMFVYEVGGLDYLAYILDESKKVCYITPYWPNYSDPIVTVPDVLVKDIMDYVKDEQIGMVDDGIHTFAKLEDAQHLIEYGHVSIKSQDRYTPVIVRCIIRAGIRHFKGAWMLHQYGEDATKRMDSYTSARLDVIEIVE